MHPPQHFLVSAGTGGRLALSAVLGIMSSFSFAPYFIWPTMLIALCCLIWLLDTKVGARHSAACGWFFGLGQFAVSLNWISLAFQFQAGMPVWFGWIAVAGLAVYLACYPAMALWIAARFWSRSPARILTLAASWSALEWLRGHFLTGFPWNTVAQVWANSPVMLQSARLTGAYGLSFVTVALFASVALVADKRARSRRAATIAALVAAAALADGWWRLSNGGPDRQAPLRVHVVQADIRQDLEMDPDRQRVILETYERLTASALRERGPGLVIWPETAVEFDVEGDGVTRFRLGQLVGNGGTLILGAVGRSYGTDGSVRGSRNSLLVINGNGVVEAAYDKAMLVPFGEYMPASWLLSRLGLVSVAAGSARFVAGHSPVTLAPPGLAPFSPLICYEIIFSRNVVDPASRPEWLLNISNDAWFGHSAGPHQHLAQARMRAVEEGLPVVRSTPTGISAIIDAYGRVEHRTSIGERSVLTANVPPALPPTLYARAGDWPFLALLFTSFMIGAGAMRRELRGPFNNSSSQGRT